MDSARHHPAQWHAATGGDWRAETDETENYTYAIAL